METTRTQRRHITLTAMARTWGCSPDVAKSIALARGVRTNGGLGERLTYNADDVERVAQDRADRERKHA